MQKEPNILSAKKLKDALWETIEALKNGAIPVNEVLAIANVSKEITRCTNTQLKIAAHTGRDLPQEMLDFFDK